MSQAEFKSVVTMSAEEAERRRREFYTAEQVARRVPGRPNKQSIYRWHAKGVRDANGKLVRLAAYRFGRKLYFHLSDVIEFARNLATAKAA